MTHVFLALLLVFARAGAPVRTPDAWSDLASAWEQAYARWAVEQQREQREFTGVVAPDLEFEPRFEALAESGDGRAVLWLLRHRQGEAEARAAGRRKDLERVRAAGRAEWVARALLELAAKPDDMDPAELARLFETLAEPGGTPELRAAAELALAGRVRASDAARAGELCLRAAALATGRPEIAPGATLAAEDVSALAVALLEYVDAQEGEWFERAFFDSGSEVYCERADSPRRPQEVWQPAINVLAERGASRARLWMLFNVWPRDEEGKERSRAYLDALSRETLSSKDLRQMGYRVASLGRVLGPEFVEPRIRAMIEHAAEDQRAGLLVGLGDALCASASDETQRARGLALLREVSTRWPGSDEAKRATGKLFRYENLVVGKRVPDFEAVDVDGNAFKLSDYEGKVTVVDFWGFW